jgi:signal transduction histidine kinase
MMAAPASRHRRASVSRGGVRLDETGGHGHGLAIVANLVEATGSTILLDDARGGGLRITLAWPITLLRQSAQR